MNLLIDASNIISGGGTSHLQELLNATDENNIKENNFSRIFIIGVSSTLDKIIDKNWIEKILMHGHEKSLFHRLWWKAKFLERTIKGNNIDLIFNPGGGYISSKYTYVTMCRNMLVFEKEESDRFSFLYKLKFRILRIVQEYSMKKADGVIFISQYAKNYIKNKSQINLKKDTVINHGVSSRFRNEVKKQKEITSYTKEKPFEILYISILDVYKHHDKVAQSVANLYRNKNYPISLTVIGGKAGGFNKFEKIRKEYSSIIKYLDKVPFNDIDSHYKKADMFIFASTCENMPNILIEAMSSGLPIASSSKQPMPEFLKESCVYFNSENINSIENAIENLLLDADKRFQISSESQHLSTNFNWEKCSLETFSFLKEIYNMNLKNRNK